MSYIGDVGRLDTTINSDVSKYTYEYIATAGQTTFTGADINSATLGYTAGNIIVTYGGSDLAYSDYTATDGTSVVLADGAVAGKIVRIVSLQAFEVADTYTKAVADALRLGTQAFNRSGSDGTIVDLQKDGTSVGSIGNVSADLIIDNSTASGGAGLALQNNSRVNPRLNQAFSDGTVDLGYSNSRWKDAYLSGGVYLGGTGAANKLDDYEEGTWTPAVSNGGTLTLGATPMAKYVKIGSQVTVWFYINCNAHSGNSQALKISGLPYTNNGGVNDYMVGSTMTYSTGNALLTNPHVRVHPDSTILTFIKNQDEAILQSEIDASYIIGSATYTST